MPGHWQLLGAYWFERQQKMSYLVQRRRRASEDNPWSLLPARMLLVMQVYTGLALCYGLAMLSASGWLWDGPGYAAHYAALQRASLAALQ